MDRNSGKTGQFAERLTVVGVGRLGLCFSVLAAHAGFEVTGVDCNKALVSRISSGTPEWLEPELEFLLRSTDRFQTKQEIVSALEESDLVFVFVATPSLPDGKYDFSQIDAVVEDLARLGRQQRQRHLIIGCTTTPMECDRVYRALAPLNWSVTYHPQFIAQGTIINDLRKPDLVLIGRTVDSPVERILEIHRRICDRPPAAYVMSLQSAEIAKLALNCFLTTKIAFANMLGDLSERCGAETEKVLEAIGGDTRVGTKFFKYGDGYGGPCLPRDNRAIAAFAEGLGAHWELGKATDGCNRRHLEEQVERFCRNRPTTAGEVELGPVTYKPQSDSIEESQSLAFACELARRGYKVVLRDKGIVLEKVRTIYGGLFHAYRET